MLNNYFFILIMNSPNLNYPIPSTKKLVISRLYDKTDTAICSIFFNRLIYSSDLGFQISERVDYQCTLQPEIPNPKSDMYRLIVLLSKNLPFLKKY